MRQVHSPYFSVKYTLKQQEVKLQKVCRATFKTNAELLSKIEKIFQETGGGLQLAIEGGGKLGTEAIEAATKLEQSLGKSIKDVGKDSLGLGSIINKIESEVMGGDGTDEAADAINRLKNIGDYILDVMESSGGHTLDRHVGKSKEYLIERTKKLKGKGATTYINKDIATKSVRDVLSKNSNDIVEWLNNSTDERLIIKTEHSFDVGNGVLKKTDTLVEGLRKTITIIERTNDNELGFRIITSYPVFNQEVSMKFLNIIYFCDCYLVMLDYEEELIDIIGDFKKKEINEKLRQLKNECEEILSLDDIKKMEEIKKVIINCADLDIESDEMQEILEYVYKNL